MRVWRPWDRRSTFDGSTECVSTVTGESTTPVLCQQKISRKLALRLHDSKQATDGAPGILPIKNTLQRLNKIRKFGAQIENALNDTTPDGQTLCETDEAPELKNNRWVDESGKMGPRTTRWYENRMNEEG